MPKDPKYIYKLIKNLVQLLGDSNKGCPATQFFKFLSSNIGACRPHTTKNILNGDINISSVVHLYCLPFRCTDKEEKKITKGFEPVTSVLISPIFFHSSVVLLHGSC